MKLQIDLHKVIRTLSHRIPAYLGASYPYRINRIASQISGKHFSQNKIFV